MNSFRIENLIIGESRSIRMLRERVTKLATSRVPVLIQGPTGAGKELVAVALHQLSGRPGLLVPVNVSAIAEPMFEDAFFGHVKGAFSDAVRDATGTLAEADRGTLFLDEIGSLARSAQPKLLRAIVLGRYRPVGANGDRHSDFRVVAAANEDLQALVETGQFRFDLLQRLRASLIIVPPLAERREDIPLLVDAFQSRVHPSAAHVKRFSADAIEWFRERPWPGNVRELKNVVESLLAEVQDKIIGSFEIECIAPPVNRPGTTSSTVGVERRELLQVLDTHGWDIQSVAQSLGVHRVTVWRWMQRYGIRRPRFGALADARIEGASATH